MNPRAVNMCLAALAIVFLTGSAAFIMFLCRGSTIFTRRFAKSRGPNCNPEPGDVETGLPVELGPAPGPRSTQRGGRPGRRHSGEASCWCQRSSPVDDDHPPVYCIEDFEEPPPTYRSANMVRPTLRELAALKHRLVKLRNQRNTYTDEYSRAVRESEIASLGMWIGQLEAIDGIPVEGVDEPVRRPLFGRRRGTTPSFSYMHETGWLGVGVPREILPRLEDQIMVLRNQSTEGLTEEEGKRKRKHLRRLQAIWRVRTRMQQLESEFDGADAPDWAVNGL